MHHWVSQILSDLFMINNTQTLNTINAYNYKPNWSKSTQLDSQMYGLQMYKLWHKKDVNNIIVILQQKIYIYYCQKC